MARSVSIVLSSFVTRSRPAVLSDSMTHSMLWFSLTTRFAVGDRFSHGEWLILFRRFFLILRDSLVNLGSLANHDSFLGSGSLVKRDSFTGTFLSS